MPTQLVTKPAALRVSRLLTAAEFHRLADVPPEVEWFANLTNPHTRRAYENAMQRLHALHRHRAAGGISHRDARACHRLARRPGAARRLAAARSGTGSRRSPRCSNISARRTPSPITRSKASSGRRRKAAKARRRRSAITRRASCWTRPQADTHQEQARPRHSLHAAVPRAAARGTVQAQGQGRPARAQRRAASQGVRQRRQDALSAAASRHPGAHSRLPRRRRARRR